MGGGGVVISQAFGRESKRGRDSETERERERVRERESEAHGDSPSERIAFALLQEPPALGHKEGEKGNYGILYQAGQRHRIFSKETRERNSSVAEKEGKKREKREERVLGPVRRETDREMPV